MAIYQDEILENRLQRLKVENATLKQQLVSSRTENKALLKRVKDLDSFFHSHPSGTMLIQQGKVLDINAGMEKQLGYSLDAVIGFDFAKLVDPDQRDLIGDHLKRWLSGKGLEGRYEISIITKSGQILSYDTRVNKVIYNRRNALILSMVESGGRITLERERIAEEKLKTGALMASGISREFRDCLNPLFRVAEEMRSESSGKDVANLLENWTLKAAAVLEKLDLLTGQAGKESSKMFFSLDKVIDRAINSSADLWKTWAISRGLNINVKTFYRSFDLVEGDLLELQEAVASIIDNAYNAMSDDGDILISTEDSSSIVHIYVQDNGEGIPDNIVENIFDPFFTTRGNEFLGLGLSTAHAIVKRHKGEIRVSSSKGNGSVFEIRFPKADRTLIRHGSLLKKKIKDSRILLLQREDIVKQVLVQMLTDKGCKIDQASGIPEAIKVIKKRRFDLVIADTEQLINDEKLFMMKIREVDPDIRIILVATQVEEETGIYDMSNEDLRMVKPLDLNRAVRSISDLLMGRLDV